MDTRLIERRVNAWLGLSYKNYYSPVKEAIERLNRTKFMLMDNEKFDYYDSKEPYVIYLGDYTYCRNSILELSEIQMFFVLVSEVMNVQTDYFYKFKSDYTDIKSIRGNNLRNLYKEGFIKEFMWASYKNSNEDWATLFDEKFANSDKYLMSKTSNNKAMLLRYALIELGNKELGDTEIVFDDANVIEFHIYNKGSLYKKHGKNFLYDRRTKTMLTRGTTSYKEYSEVKNVFCELSEVNL